MSDLIFEDGYTLTDDLNIDSFEQVIEENFNTFYLFHEVFSKPACYRMNPLLALYPWKPQILRMFHK